MKKKVEYSMICLLEDGTPLNNHKDTVVEEQLALFQARYILQSLEKIEGQKQEEIYQEVLRKLIS